MKHPKPIGFDTDRYIRFQSAFLRRVLRQSHDRLYIEFGGKIIQDRHSARVLPGYREDTKLELIKELCQNGEALFVISAN